MTLKETIALSKIIEEEYSNITGVVIEKDNEIVFENYYNGYNQYDTIHIASVTKSIISALVGIAIDKGFIENIEQSILGFFQGYEIKRGEKTIQKVKVKDLLAMMAPYKFKYEPYTKVLSSDNWTKAALDLVGGKGKIGEFKYTTVGLQVLSGILTNATGHSIVDFATENLFKHLDIVSPDNVTVRDKEEYLAFIKNEYVNGWVTDPQGVNTAGWGLCLSSRDMAKIGRLYLNMGRWNNKQILSQSWIETSVKEQSKWNELSYGYLWWIMDEDYRRDFAALGDGGNVIYVSPIKQTVIAITSKFMPRAKDRIDLIKNTIMPMLETD